MIRLARNRPLRWLCVGVLAAAGFALWRANRHVDLLERARLVVPDLTARGIGGMWAGYGWLTSSRVRTDSASSAAGHSVVEDIDIRSGQRTRVKVKPPKGALPFAYHISPDGNWIVWGLSHHVRGVAPDILYHVFQNLGTGESFKTTLEDWLYSDFSWSPDRRYCAIVRGKLAEARRESWDVRLAVVDLKQRTEREFGPTSGVDQVCALTSPDSIITSRSMGTRRELFRVASRRSAEQGVFANWLPHEEHLAPVESSPVGNRVLWHGFRFCERPPGVIGRFLQLFRFDRDKSESILGWCRLLESSSDATHMRELGQVAVVSEGDAPSELHYLPDGRSISFIYRGGLYILPID
jgi:hypothetical protein